MAPDLPGHGSDDTPIAEITLDSYADRICEVVRTQSEPVILVGHSMGGAAITQAAEWCASSLRLLIYLTAYIPVDGTSVAEQAMEDSESLLGKHVTIDSAAGTADLESDAVTDCFYGDCSRHDIALARQHLCTEPAAPLTSPLELSQRGWGSVPRVYIECLKDRTLTLEMQRRIQSRSSCGNVFSLATSHSPFLSDPEALAEHLLAAETLAG